MVVVMARLDEDALTVEERRLLTDARRDAKKRLAAWLQSLHVINSVERELTIAIEQRRVTQKGGLGRDSV